MKSNSIRDKSLQFNINFVSKIENFVFSSILRMSNSDSESESILGFDFEYSDKNQIIFLYNKFLLSHNRISDSKCIPIENTDFTQ